jgi:hypothetical protein
MSSKQLSEKEKLKYLEKIKKIDDKIEKVNEILFITNQFGEKEMRINSSTKYLLSKLKPLLKEQDKLYNKMYPNKKNIQSTINYLENMNQIQEQDEIDNYLD